MTSKIKQIAVENFLASLSDNERNDRKNLGNDAHAYNWSIGTVRAISDGITKYYASRKTVLTILSEAGGQNMIL
jgi:hypothetical protein